MVVLQTAQYFRFRRRVYGVSLSMQRLVSGISGGGLRSVDKKTGNKIGDYGVKAGDICIDMERIRIETRPRSK